MKQITLALLILCFVGCEKTIQTAYQDWRELEKEYKESHTVRGNIWPELEYSRNSKEHETLLSFGTESEDFLIVKFIESRTTEYDEYDWDSFFAYDILKFEGIELDLAEMTPNDVATYVHQHLKRNEPKEEK